MTHKFKDRIVIGLCLLLSLALIMSLVFYGVLSVKSKEADAKNKSTISSYVKANEELEERLDKAQKENKSLEGEKKKLEKENSSLKSKIKKLSSQKKKSGTVATSLSKSTKKAVSKPVSKTVKTTVSQNPKPTGKVCYLTFDDGPTKNTLKILEVLDEYNAKATFFVIDTPQTKIEYIKKVHEKGHTVGLHSSSHNYAKIYKSSKNYFADLTKISKKVESLTGIKSKVIRFPGGGSNTVSKSYKKGIMTYLTRKVTEKGYTYFDWNLDSGDASGTTVSRTRIVNNVLKGAKGKNSVCVLMHDSLSKTTTVEALPYILKGLKKQGFTFKPLTKECYGYHHSVLN